VALESNQSEIMVSEISTIKRRSQEEDRKTDKYE